MHLICLLCICAGDLAESPFQFWADRQMTVHRSADIEVLQQKSSPWQSARGMDVLPASEHEQAVIRLGPAIPLLELQSNFFPSAARQCVPNPDLAKLLTALSQPKLLSQQKITSKPAPGPALKRRAPVQGGAQDTAPVSRSAFLIIR